MGNEAKAALITTGRQRISYFGTGTVSNTNEDGLKKALAAAQPGDTVQQLSLAKIAAPYRTGEQIRIPAGVNYDTGGFDIDATGYCDGIILVGGTGVIHGGNATISHNVNGSWGIGWYGGGMLDYRIYDLNINTAVDGREYFANPFAIYLPECRVYHTGSIISTTPVAILTHNISGGAGNQYEHVGTVTGLGNGALFGVSLNGRMIQRGDVVVTENATAGAIHAGASLSMHGGELDLRSAQPNAGFKLDPAGILHLIDVTVLGDQLPALLMDPAQGSGAMVHLYGDTIVPNLTWPAGITVVDHRPVSTVAGNATNSNKADLVNGTVPGNQLPTDVTSPVYINNQGTLDVRLSSGLALDSNSSALEINFTDDLVTAQDYQVPTATALRAALAKAGSTVKTEPVTGDNLLDLTDPDILADYYINENYIGDPTNVSGWTSSGFIPVKSGQTYAANNNVTHSAWFDAGHQFIASYGSTSGVAPANAAYLRVSVQTPGFNSLMVVLGASSNVPATYQKFWKRLLTTTPRPFTGKKIGLVGDSLTLQGFYINSLVSELEASGYVQQGFSGEVFRSGIDMLPANAFAGCGLIQVMFGTNEYGHGGNTLGTTSDTSSANTICGVVRYAYEVLHAQYPEATIYFVTPTERGDFAGEPVSPTQNPYGLTIKLIGEAIKAVCRSLDVPFVDLYESSNINSLTFAQTLQSDNLHWSSAGAAYVGKVIGKTINTLLS